MDPLSISTGIAGLASLAIQLAPAIHEYIATAKKAEQDISWFADEVDAIIEVCVCLDDFLKADALSQRNNFRTTDSVLGRTVTSCDACLRKLGSLLQLPTGWTQKLKWPFRKKPVEDIIRRLGRYTALFQFALTVEGHAVLSNTPKDVENLLKLQVDASYKLHEITKGIDALSTTAEKYRSSAEKMSSLLEGIQSLTEASDQLSLIQKDVGSIKRQLTDSYDMEILEWLSPEHGRGRHCEVGSRRTPGTGKWILDMPDFQKWLDKESSQRIVWLVGDPGCGKSTLLSFVVDELKESYADSQVAIAYYYCDYRVQNVQPIAAALGGLLRLLLERIETIPPILRDTFEKSRREGRKPLSSELKEILLSVTASFERCFILVDAMDEFSISDTANTSQFILTLDELAASGVDILVTSRALPSPPLKTGHAIKRIHANEADISSYLAHALHADDSLTDVLDKALERDISQTIIKQAKGMFLLAVLHLQNIRGQVTRSGVRKALKNLSGGLSDAYNKTFECIQHQSQARQKLAFDSLMWVSVSYRPLKSIELQHALATQLDDEEWDPDNIPSLRLIIRSCCGLLAVDDLDSSESEVRLVHNTLHHYLHTSQPDWANQANLLITQTSLTYLHFTSSASRCSEESENSNPSTTTLILTPFARDNWGHHAKRLPSTTATATYQKSALSLLQNNLLLRKLYPGKNHTTGLHIASTFGLPSLLKTLLKRRPTPQIDKIEKNSNTPLYKACKNNHLDCAKLLLSHGAKPDPPIPSITPLYTCVVNKNLALASLLLDYGADPDTPCADGWTALHKAADDGNLDLVQLLVLGGGSLTRSSARGLTALHRAAGRGFVDVITFLLGHGARVDSVSWDEWTPVHGAASAGWTRAVSFLLLYHEQNCASVSVSRRRTGFGSRSGSSGDVGEKEKEKDIATLAGGVNFQTRDGHTPLHLACQGAHVDTVEALLSAGASVELADIEGDLALHIAAREGNAVILEILLREHGSRGMLECRNLKGWTPLQEAQLSGIYEAEQMLWGMSGLSLESGSGTASGTASGSHSAVQGEELVKAIREDDVEAVCGVLGLGGEEEEEEEEEEEDEKRQESLERRNQGGRSPLQQALHFGSLDVARMLLISGASIYARSDPGQWTALHYAALSGRVDAVKLCLLNGAEMDARTQQEQTPLHHACRRGAEDAVRLLLDHGADVEVIDDRDWMPVHIAAAGGHERVVRLLLEHGDSAQTPTVMTSIQAVAAQRGHHGLVELTRKWRYSWMM